MKSDEIVKQPEFDTPPRLEEQVLDKLGLGHLKDKPTKAPGVTVGRFLDAYPPGSPHLADTLEQLQYFMALQEGDQHFETFRVPIENRIISSLATPES